MLKKIKELFKKHLFNKKGNDIVAVALILLFIILAAAPYLKNLGQTTSNGVNNLNTQMEEVLDGN